MLKCLESTFCLRSHQRQNDDEIKTKNSDILTNNKKGIRATAERGAVSRIPPWAKEALKEYKQKSCRNRSHQTSCTMSMVDSIIGDLELETNIRLIFLDVDGTINHLGGGDDLPEATVCPTCVKTLRQILDQTGSKIVLSSSWRLERRHRKTLFRYLRTVELAQGVIVGETRDLSSYHKNRTDEIKDWLANPNLYNKSLTLWPQQIQGWVSLDDLDLAGMEEDEKLKCHHVSVNPKLGLCMTENIVGRVVQQLSRSIAHVLLESVRSNRSSFIFKGHEQDSLGHLMTPRFGRAPRFQSRSSQDNREKMTHRSWSEMVQVWNPTDDDESEYPSIILELNPMSENKPANHLIRRASENHSALQTPEAKNGKRALPRSLSHPVLPTIPPGNSDNGLFANFSIEVDSLYQETEESDENDTFNANENIYLSPHYSTSTMRYRKSTRRSGFTKSLLSPHQSISKKL